MRTKSSIQRRNTQILCALSVLVLWLTPQVAQAYTISRSQTITSSGQQFTFNFTGLPRATGNVTVRVDVYGDYGLASEYADVLSIDGVRPASNRIPGPSNLRDCNTATVLNQTYKNFTVSSTTVNNNNALSVIVRNSASVNTGCSRKQVVVRLTYASPPDLQVSFLSVTPTNPTQGGRVTIRYRLRNAGGDAASSAKVRFYFSTNNIISTGDAYLNVERTVTVAGNGSWPSTTGTSTVFANLPANAATGTRYVGAIADYDRQISESNEGNNTRAATVSVRAATTRDLEVRLLTVTPAAAAPGGSVTVRYQLRNNGTATSGTFATRLYFSTNNIISTFDPYLNVERSLSLGAGASSTIYTATVRIPTNALTGARFIGALADYNSRITETNENNNYTVAPITITAGTPRADLQVAFLSVTPTTVNQGGRITIRYRLRNAGNASATGVKTRFYFSNSSTINTIPPGNTYLNVERTDSVAAGAFFPSATGTSTVFVNIPAGAAPGGRYIGAFTDSGLNISESNENNNTRATAITVRAATTRDLEVRLLTLSSRTARPGDNVTVRYQLRNNGTATSGTFVTRLYFSTNNIISTGDTYLNVERSLSLARGASSAIYTATVRIPASAQTSVSYIGALADYNRRVVETNERNNYTVAPITITAGTARADLQVAFLSVTPTTLNQGGRITIRYRLRNAGNASATGVKTRFYFSTNSIISTADTYLTNTERTNTLAAGAFFPSATGISTIFVNIPADATTGTRYIGAFIDYDAKIPENLEGNNTRLATITVRAATTRDLEVRLLTVSPTTAAQGGTVTVRYQLRNNGTATSGTFATRLYFSTNNIISTGDTYLNVERSLSLAAGASSTIYTATVRVPTNALTGARFIGALADYNGRVTESNESNNYTVAPITISTSTSRADLQVDFLSVTPTTVSQGGRITIRYRLRNAGGATATGVKTRFYFSTNSLISTFDTYLTNTERTNTLAGGAYWPSVTGTSTIFVNIPANALVGTPRYIGAIIDHDRKISESNENNNTRSASITVNAVQTRDLEVRLLTVSPTTAAAGTRVTVRYQLRNNGNTTSGTFATRLYISTNNIISTGDIYLNVERSLSLAAGASSVVYSAVVTIPAGISASTRYIGALADYNFRVSETNESNNYRAAAITIGAASRPDLVAVSVILSPNRQDVGKTVSVAYKIDNKGDADVGTFNVRIYFSTDTTINASDRTLVTFSRAGVVKGASLSGVRTVTLPTTLPLGNGYIGMWVDYDGKVAEKSETNNTTAAPLTVTKPVEVRPEARVEPRPEPRVEPVVEAKAEPVVDTRVEVRPEPRVEPVVEAKVDAGVETTPEASNESKPETKVEVRPEVKVEAGIETTPESMSERAPEVGTEATPEQGPDGDCYTNGCPSGEVCKKGQCVADPCANKQCGTDEFCRDGRCVKACGCLRCKSGEACVDGACVSDPCASVSCTNGEVCDATSGKCITDPCASVTCGKGRVCVAGTCEDDPCNNVTCASGMECRKGQCVGLNCAEVSTEATPDAGSDAGAGETVVDTATNDTGSPTDNATNDTATNDTAPDTQSTDSGTDGGSTDTVTDTGKPDTAVVDTTTGGDKSRSRPDRASPTPGGCCDINSENQHMPFQFFLLLGLVMIVGFRRRR